MCVRRGVQSSPPVAFTTFANVCTRNLWKKSSVALKESVAITLSTDFDLAIERPGVRSVSFPIWAVPLQVCSQCLIEWSLPRSLVLRNFGALSSLFSSKICESLRDGLEIFSRSHRSRLAYHWWIPVRWCSRAGSVGANVRCRRCLSS